MKYVDVMLVPVTEEEGERLHEAAQTLHHLARVSGRQEHRDQANYVESFASKRGRWEAQYSVSIAEAGEE